MPVKLLFFAQCADMIGFGELDLPLDHPQKLDDYISGSSLLKPLLQMRKSVQVAVNREIADFKTEIKDHDEIAFLPPYSGG